MPTIQDIMAKKKAFEDELKEGSKAALSEEFKKVFETYPDCLAIHWHQYTSYWNDGDVCEFSVYDFDVKMNDTLETDKDNYCDKEGFETVYRASKRGVCKNTIAAIEALKRIDEQIYEAAFGDHAKIVATRKGFDVSELEHD